MGRYTNDRNYAFFVPVDWILFVGDYFGYLLHFFFSSELTILVTNVEAVLMHFLELIKRVLPNEMRNRQKSFVLWKQKKMCIIGICKQLSLSF